MVQQLRALIDFVKDLYLVSKHPHRSFFPANIIPVPGDLMLSLLIFEGTSRAHTELT